MTNRYDDLRQDGSDEASGEMRSGRKRTNDAIPAPDDTPETAGELAGANGRVTGRVDWKPAAAVGRSGRAENPAEAHEEPELLNQAIPSKELPSDAPIRHPLALHVPEKKTGLINPVVLAYMGDAVFELLVRQYLISLPNNKSHHLHSEATKRVSAKAQRLSLERLQPLLTEEEADIVRRGRNTKSGAPPRNADPADYRQATALECLFGHLYFEGRMERIGELMRVVLEERG